ncbi:uncharacterized protein LOC124089953 isoform X2 [Marmota monax]|nr:uncharacterized protein LOC124089953 isoform X2 [Marmota monax]XP_058433644.1 uncharacterized protein LOC124089953 isoform X2 [Marmota monax]XP_058433645.1 uncharacterized protein LOC124089953 isoform X2 [Marmota monax]XP_058433646.1 uncharacterized protein LOC124089953 isoform X2 [Marmota monax]XP_058433647.1 uncharacterized protein LOC124089953 isoform X2 [Marmota monax]XP_058433648.1 uncharacterized protein LOC124089953 isoform X2 [Marmota monax]XP_058433649.1 uncharacterized protein LO
MGEMELEVAVLEEMEREIAAWNEVETAIAAAYELEMWIDAWDEMKTEMEAMDEIERIRHMLGPLAHDWSILILSKEQREELEAHFPKHCFLLLDELKPSSIRLDPQKVEDWLRMMQQWIKFRRSSQPSGSCLVHSTRTSLAWQPRYWPDSFCTCPSTEGAGSCSPRNPGSACVQCQPRECQPRECPGE